MTNHATNLPFSTQDEYPSIYLMLLFCLFGIIYLTITFPLWGPIAFWNALKRKFNQ